MFLFPKQTTATRAKRGDSEFTLAQVKCIIPYLTLSGAEFPPLPFMGWQSMAGLRLVAVTPGPDQEGFGYGR